MLPPEHGARTLMRALKLLWADRRNRSGRSCLHDIGVWIDALLSLRAWLSLYADEGHQ